MAGGARSFWPRGRRHLVHDLPRNYRLRHPAVLLGTWLGSGLLRPGSGTWGSLAALPVGLAVAWLAGALGLAVATILITAAGTWSAAVLGRATGETDASLIVVDEVAGMWLTLAIALPMVGMSPIWIVVAFALFRLGDVVKPWPAGAIDAWKTAAGVMLDDIVAGGYAGLAVLGLAGIVTSL